MFKKIFAIATVMCVIPMMASAATMETETSAMSQGGVIDSRNMTGQTVINGTISKTTPTSYQPDSYSHSESGFKISKLSENGYFSVPPAGSYTSTNTGTSNFSLQATFARSLCHYCHSRRWRFSRQDQLPGCLLRLQSPAKSFIFTPDPVSSCPA